MSIDFKSLVNLYNSGKFTNLNEQLVNLINLNSNKDNKNLHKLNILNLNQLNKNESCIHYCVLFIQNFDLDLDVVQFFYLNCEKKKKLNYFYQKYKLLFKSGEVKIKSHNINILAEKLLNFLLLKNEPNLSLLTLHNYKNSNKFDKSLICFLIAKVLYSKRKYHNSLFWFKKSSLLKTENKSILVEIGNIYNLLRDKKKALKNLNAAEKSDFLKPRIYKILSTIYDYSAPVNNLDDMLKYSIKNSEKHPQSYLLNFAIAKAYEDKSDYKSSFFFFKKANGQKINNIKNGVNIYKDEIDFFYNLFVNNKNFFLDLNGYKDQAPIFITGLPRSGTTLIDRILSSYNDIRSFGETNFFSSQFKYFFDIYDPLETKKDILNLANKEIQGFGKMYCKNFNLKNKYNFFIDKLPFNYVYIPMIKKFLPNSKIILAERDLRDVGLSLLKNNFADARLNFAYSENDIIDYFKSYKKIINFIKKEFSDSFHVINYSKLISNPTLEIEGFFKKFNITKDVSKDTMSKIDSDFIADTVSINQADKNVYNSSDKIYLKYKEYLNIFFDKINLIQDDK